MRFVLFSLLLAVGLFFAIQPASDWTAGTPGKYYPAGAMANVTTEGGNVTELNLSGNVSTERWAGFWGNITGQIVLAPNTSAFFFTWAWKPTDGGVVCAVDGSIYTWDNLYATNNTAIDNAWGFSGGADDANHTYNSTCNIKVNGISLTSVGNATGQGNFETCVIANTTNPQTKSDFAFCANITEDTLFNGQTGNYELLVPTNETAGSIETYYFWLELA